MLWQRWIYARVAALCPVPGKHVHRLRGVLDFPERMCWHVPVRLSDRWRNLLQSKRYVKTFLEILGSWMMLKVCMWIVLEFLGDVLKCAAQGHQKHPCARQLLVLFGGLVGCPLGNLKNFEDKLGPIRRRKPGLRGLCAHWEQSLRSVQVLQALEEDTEYFPVKAALGLWWLFLSFFPYFLGWTWTFWRNVSQFAQRFRREQCWMFQPCWAGFKTAQEMSWGSLRQWNVWGLISQCCGTWCTWEHKTLAFLLHARNIMFSNLGDGTSKTASRRTRCNLLT